MTTIADDRHPGAESGPSLGELRNVGEGEGRGIPRGELAASEEVGEGPSADREGRDLEVIPYVDDRIHGRLDPLDEEAEEVAGGVREGLGEALEEVDELAELADGVLVDPHGAGLEDVVP